MAVILIHAYVLRKYVRENPVFSLEEAIHKMTGKAASAFRLRDRGVLAAGKAADLIIFKDGTIRDRATFTEPVQFPEGIEQVYVNGVLTVDHGTHTDARSGRVLIKNHGYIV